MPSSSRSREARPSSSRPARTPAAAASYIRRNGVLVQDEPADQIVPRVVARLVELEALWQRKGAPADRVYETLRQVVMPEARPAEIFLYAQPIGPAQALRPRSVGAMLAAWAVKADQVDDLARKIDARKSQPLAQLGAGVLRAQLARAAHRDADLNAALGALAERLKKDTLRTTADLALHAALPALDRDETRKAALDLLEVAVRGFEGPDQSEPLATLLLLSARNRFKTGDVEGGRKRLAAYLDTMERGLGDYGGDYVLYQRKVQYRNVATEFARAGLWTDTLDWLGRFVDAPRYSGGDPTAGDVLRLLVTQLASKPAKERDKALRDWTLPTASRQMVRLLSTLGPVDAPPPIFARRKRPSPAAKSLANEDLLSTADALIDAAREAGTLDTLAQEARTAAEKKIENGDVLYLLVELARGKTGEIKGRLEGRLAELVKDNATPADQAQNTRSNPQPQKPRAFPWPDYLVARAALAGPRDDVRGLAVSLLEALVEQAQRFYDQVVLARLHRDLATARARSLGAPSLALGPESGTSRWHAAASRGPSTFVPTRPLWLAHQGLVAHVAGPEQDFLLFDYPLSGSFELSFDAFHGSFAEANFAYAGLIAEPFWMGNNGQITPVGESETIQRPWRLGRPQDFNRVKIQVSPASVRFLVNDHLFHEDKDPSPTSPWLALFTRRERHTAWRNFALSGNPTIPREVRLSQGDRLEGWTCNFFGETQPPRRSTLSTDQYGNQRSVMRTTRTGAGSAPRPSVDADQYDWSARDGVIRGRRMLGQASARNVNRYYNPDQDNTTPSEAAQSLLSYHRPLRDGDVLSYEFLYEPGQVMVHPALDRLAFLLEPAGVRLHWMTTGANDTSGLLADNAVDDPEHRKGTGPLPLKPNDWNTLKLSMKGDVAALELNGQPVFERPIDQGNTRQFGLYHDKELTSVQVRNVVLKGHWPETLTDVDRRALTFEAGPDAGPEAERRARHAAIGEPFFARQAGTLLVDGQGPETRRAVCRPGGLGPPLRRSPPFPARGRFHPDRSGSRKRLGRAAEGERQAPASSGETRDGRRAAGPGPRARRRGQEAGQALATGRARGRMARGRRRQPARQARAPGAHPDGRRGRREGRADPGATPPAPGESRA